LTTKTSQWNKIEHRMFGHIAQKWRAMPLTRLLVVIARISNTSTKPDLKISYGLDRGAYPKGIKVSDADMAALNTIRDACHP